MAPRIGPKEALPGVIVLIMLILGIMIANPYGIVDARNRPAGADTPAASGETTVGMALDELLTHGMAETGKVELSPEEKAKLENSINNTSGEVKREFDTRYSAWKATWDDPDLAIYSNPRMYARSEQYNEFLAYCAKQGKAIWPPLFQKYLQEESGRNKALVNVAIMDLTYPEYGYLLNDIRQESGKAQYNASGAYTASPEETNVIKYIKKLLALE